MNTQQNSYPVAISQQLVAIIDKEIEACDVDTSDGVILNFRDPDYSAESGGYHPVEICVDAQGRIQYITDFAYYGQANQLIRRKFARGRAIISPQIAASYLPAQLALFEHETFWCLFLDNQHRVLAFEKLFTGTIDQASVYSREVVKRTLQLNAAAGDLCSQPPIWHQCG